MGRHPDHAYEQKNSTPMCGRCGLREGHPIHRSHARKPASAKFEPLTDLEKATLRKANDLGEIGWSGGSKWVSNDGMALARVQEKGFVRFKDDLSFRDIVTQRWVIREIYELTTKGWAWTKEQKNEDR